MNIISNITRFTPLKFKPQTPVYYLSNLRLTTSGLLFCLFFLSAGGPHEQKNFQRKWGTRLCPKEEDALDEVLTFIYTRWNVKNPTKNVTKQLGFLSIRLSHICLIFVGKSVLRRGPSLNFHGLEYQNNPEPLPKPFEACTR